MNKFIILCILVVGITGCENKNHSDKKYVEPFASIDSISLSPTASECNNHIAKTGSLLVRLAKEVNMMSRDERVSAWAILDTRLLDERMTCSQIANFVNKQEFMDKNQKAKNMLEKFKELYLK